MLIKTKVLTYITRQNHLLILLHPFTPEAGIQIPGGTLHEGESPAEGALREAQEETGLTALHVAAKLGEQQHDMSAYGVARLHHRHFFHLICDQLTPDIWQHGEFDPSDIPANSRTEPIIFEFQWVLLPDHVPPLIAGHDALLPELLHRMGLS